MGFLPQDVRYGTGDDECLAAGRWTLDAGRWTLDAGRWTLDAGRWTLDAGRWTLDAGRWTLDAMMKIENKNGRNCTRFYFWQCNIFFMF
ncbi:MAG: hypothetical protein H7A10_01675 [Oceanospirillaceae bacterium]|nr:hypothetical protein [Oceanospirillaceae bacterium]